MGSRYKETAENKAEAYRVYGEHLFSACDAVDALIFAKANDVISYTDHTHVITDYRYDSFGRRIHTAERTKSGMRTIYDGLSFEVVKEAETSLGTRGITSSATGEANLNNYTPQVPQNGVPNNTAPSYGSDHTKGTRYYYIPNNAQGAQTRNNGEITQSAPSYGSDHTKGTRYYYIPNNAQGAQAQHSAIPADRTKGVRTYLYLNGERVAINNLYNTNHGQYYYGSDILGSVKFVTGQGGQELKRIEYDVFGGIYKGNSPYGLETGYTGKPYDSVTGLSDYGFRDYSPKYARFITEDPIRDGENWFAYVGNNPVNWIDPWGLSASEKKAFDRQRSNPSQMVVKKYIKDTTKQSVKEIIARFNKDKPLDKQINFNILRTLFFDADEARKLLMEREDLHKDLRYQLNDEAPPTANDAKAAGMIKLPWYKSIFHNLFKNDKYVSKDGHLEGVYDKETGESDRNQSVMATFNFFDPNTQPVEHKKADVDPYLKWGN